jgi:hypothetical protein
MWGNEIHSESFLFFAKVEMGFHKYVISCKGTYLCVYSYNQTFIHLFFACVCVIVFVWDINLPLQIFMRIRDVFQMICL